MRSSPGCSSNLEKSTVRMSTRAGVPVLNLRSSNPSASSAPDRCLELPSPDGPESVCASPTMQRELR